MLPAVLEEALATGEVVRGDGIRIPLHSNVSLEEAQRLYDVVHSRSPAATIEIGFAQGISTLAIVQALCDAGADATHHVVDPLQDTVYEGVGLANLERAGLRERVRFHSAWPEEVVPTFPRAGFAFIDSSHLFDFTIVDFVLIDKRLEVGGVIGFHDYWMDSIKKVVAYILTNRRYRVHDDLARSTRPLPTDGELAADAFVRRRNLIFIEKLGHDDRDWQFHREF